MLGTYALSAGYYDAYYLKALKVRRLIRQDFDEAFADVDVIASPVTPTPAFKLGELIDDPLAMYLSDIYTISANLAGIPGISLPCGFSTGGLPIGLQLLAAAVRGGTTPASGPDVRAGDRVAVTKSCVMIRVSTLDRFSRIEKVVLTGGVARDVARYHIH